MNNGAMLNAYPDSLGGSLSAAADFLSLPACRDAFRSFYLLPSLFHSDLDRGFSVISYDLNRRLATEEDIARLKAIPLDLKVDFVLNHLSVLSPQFQDILRCGDASPYRDFFIDWNRFWAGHGEMTEEGYIQPDDALMKDMFLRKPGLPILMVRLPDGREVPYWNTFYQEVCYPSLDSQTLMDECGLQYAEATEAACILNEAFSDGRRPAEADLTQFGERRELLIHAAESRRRYLGQMDLNIQSPLVWDFYRKTIHRLAEYGAAIIRLDAFAYAPKAVGRRNFMNEPETWELLDRVRELADTENATLLPEIHDTYESGVYRKVAQKGYMTYDFFLPGLILDAIENRRADMLALWARELRDEKIHTVNMLGCHDGIPMLDLKGMLPQERIQGLIDLIVSRGGKIKNLHGKKNIYYQVNATYYSALGEDDRKLLLARAIQLFMPGKPQIWYLDLFAGKNDYDAVRRAGEAGHKEINRTNLSSDVLRAALDKPVVRKQLQLLRLRNTCPAFAEGAALDIPSASSDCLLLAWSHCDTCAELEANFQTGGFCIRVDGEKIIEE